MKKISKISIMALAMTASMSFSAFAGTWNQADSGWKYQQDDGSYATSTWQWIDGNNDGTSECYYFDANGNMAVNTTTADGYTVNENGAWVKDGVIQVQQSVSGNVDAKQLLMDASKKNSELTSVAASAKIDMTVTAEGQSIPMSMTMDMKMKDLNTSNMKYLANINVNLMGQSVPMTMFYTDGYMYMDAAGQKVKQAMNMDEIMKEVESGTAFSSTEFGTILEAQAVKDSNGNTVITAKYDTKQLMDMVNQVYANMGMDMSGANVTIKDMSCVSVVNPAGYLLSENIVMDMDMSVEGQTANIKMNMDMTYPNAGQPVDFTLPSTDGYVEGTV